MAKLRKPKKEKPDVVKFRPSASVVDSAKLDGYTQEEIDAAMQAVLQERELKREQEEAKKATVFQKLSAIWTLLSAGYIIVATIMFIVKDFVDSTMSYVLVAMLSVYVVVYIVLIALTVNDVKRAKKRVKVYKKFVGTFKVFANITFMVISATAMAGIARQTDAGRQVLEWIMFGITFLVALVQFALKTVSLITMAVKHYAGKKFHVSIERYVDGKKLKKTLKDRMKEKKYE